MEIISDSPAAYIWNSQNNQCTLWIKKKLYCTVLYYCRIMEQSRFPKPSLNTLGSFVFQLCCGQTDKQTNRQTDKQTNRQTDSLENPTDIVGVGSNTSFRTIIAFYSPSLGDDTSTITLPPRFIVIRYSLGGDTDKSNTAWVRTLWVHSSWLVDWSTALVEYVE